VNIVAADNGTTTKGSEMNSNSPAAKLARYALAGLVIAAFWYLNRHRPLWEEMARTIVVFSLIMVALRLKLRRRGVDVHLIPLIGTKAVLVVAAAGVEEALKNHGTEHRQVIVACGLGVAFALAGFLFDRFFFSLLPRDPSPNPPCLSNPQN
jgi:peptidoglycan/LPS O-acetylase OafA/YrhL